MESQFSFKEKIQRLDPGSLGYIKRHASKLKLPDPDMHYG
jgi:hypothetical protein